MFPEMQLWMQDIIKNMKLTDLCIGTVLQLTPVKIDFGDNKIITDVGTNIFYTEQVIEKKIELEHTHIVEINNVPYGTLKELKTYTINEGIKEGDKLIMLKCLGGQKFIVLSKIRDTSSIVIS